MIMMLTLCIVVGFKRTVTQKVTGFDAHIQLINFQTNDSYNLDPIPVTDSLLTALKEIEHVVSVSPFITKPGMLKTDSAFVGVVLKGTDYWSFFAQNLKEGHLPQADQEVLLSSGVARQLQLHVNDRVLSYFIDEKNVRARPLTISGIYKTGFEQYDNIYVLTNISTMRSLQKWDSCMYSEFTKMSAGQPRLTQTERFRQRFMHKLVYYPANNEGLFSCVGCGRCLQRCPIHMNIVKVMKTMGGKDA